MGVKRYIAERPEIKPRKERVVWTEEERDKIATNLWRLRKDGPDESIIDLIDAAQSDLPEDRRRKIDTVGAVPYLFARLTEIDRKMMQVDGEARAARETVRQVMEQNQALRAQIQSQTPEAILAALDEDEVVNRFGRIVLDNTSVADVVEHFGEEELLSGIPLPKVAAFFWENFVGLMGGGIADIGKMAHAVKQNTHVPHVKHYQQDTPVQKKVRLPRVFVTGPKGDQVHILKENLKAVAEVNCLHRSQKRNIPGSYDLYVVWTRFSTHSIYDAMEKAAGDKSRFVVHSQGGLELLTQCIAERAAKVNVLAEAV